MSAIEHCRTDVLGGHVLQCPECEHVQISYNSCLTAIARSAKPALLNAGYKQDKQSYYRLSIIIWWVAQLPYTAHMFSTNVQAIKSPHGEDHLNVCG
jgi:hypothetical protein